MDATSIPDIGDINYNDRLTPGINVGEPESSGRADNDVNYHDANRDFASSDLRGSFNVNASSTSSYTGIKASDYTSAEESNYTTCSSYVCTSRTGIEVRGYTSSQYGNVCYATGPLGVHSALRVDKQLNSSQLQKRDRRSVPVRSSHLDGVRSGWVPANST
jgi:hypothetical protein